MTWLRVFYSVGLLFVIGASASGVQAQSQSNPSGGRRPAASQRDSMADVSQPEATDSTRRPNGTRTQTGAGSAQIPGDVIFLKGPDGQYVPVPKNATLMEYLDFVRRKGRAPAAEHQQSGYSVTSIALAGEADDERATLTAAIQIQVHADEDWVRVPLRLNEAVLVDTAYEGPGEAIFDHQGGSAETGHSWWLKGKGLHELKLSVIVPVQKQTPSRRLQLALPPTAVSSLKLRVPLERVSVKASERSATKTQSLGTGGCEIVVYGLGTLLDLQWQPSPDGKQVETVLESATSLTLGMPGDSVLLTATQQVRALQGTFETLRVRLPRELDLLDLKTEPASTHEVDPDNPNEMTVTFAEPTTGPVELGWTFESKLPPEKAVLRLEGFQVTGARRETGQIALRRVEGYRFAPNMDDSQFVHRINAGELVGNGQIASAYRFLQQPFRLVLDLERVKPYYTAEPNVYLTFSAERVALDGVIRFQIYRGAVDEVELEWPHWQSEGWEIQSLESPGLVERVSFDSETDRSTFHIRLVQRKTGRFELPIKASRRVHVGDEKRFEVSLPSAHASSLLPTVLVLANADNVETEFTAAEGNTLRPVPLQSRPSIDVPEELRSLRRTAFRIDPQTHTFSADVTVHARQIRTEMTAQLDLQEDRLSVRQRISYNVAYEPVSEAVLTVPESVAGRVAFSAEDGSPLSPTWTRLEGSTGQMARVPLPQPRLGRFSILAGYGVPVPPDVSPGRPATLSVPLIQTADATYTSARLQCGPPGALEPAATDRSWTRQLDDNDAVVWSTDSPPSEVPLRVTLTGHPSSQEYTIRKALIRTVADEQGFLRSRAEYQIEGRLSAVELQFGSNVLPEFFWWDDTKLTAEQIHEVESEAGHYRLELAAAPQSGQHLLTVDYHSENAAPFGWGQRHELSAPRFPSDVWVEQTVWNVVLPFNQHLFTNPTGFTPQFRWQRSTVFWDRTPEAAYADLESWISASKGPAERPEFSEGNSYTFSRFGPANSLAFDSMSRSLIVLFGAGLTLAVGFVLLKIPATRSMLTLFVIVFGLALAGLWQPAAVQVLLQPALLGLLLAVAAAFLEGALKKEQPSAGLTLSSPSDYVSPSASSVVSSVGVGAGSDDPTVQRSIPTGGREHVSSSSSELQSHV